MGTLNLAMPACEMTGLPPRLSRRLLRRLVVGHGLGVGSRVLVAGHEVAGLVAFFDHLGLIASGTDVSAVGVEVTPSSRFAPAGDPPWDEAGWDLALGLDLSSYHGSLYSSAALHATAELLSCARPDAYAMLLVRSGGRGFAAAGHDASCFVRHLSCFRGELVASEIPDGLAAVDPLSWIVGRRPRPGYLLAGLRLPTEALSRFEWHDQAERAVRADDCCRLSPEVRGRSAA